jgi:hypothetical protein
MRIVAGNAGESGVCFAPTLAVFEAIRRKAEVQRAKSLKLDLAVSVGLRIFHATEPQPPLSVGKLLEQMGFAMRIIPCIT